MAIVLAGGDTTSTMIETVIGAIQRAVTNRRMRQAERGHMNTTELRQSFKHIHAYQDWQRQCEALVNEIDRQYFLVDTLDSSHKYLSHRLAEAGRKNKRLRAALEFYADPFAWKKKHDPQDDIKIPNFYSETSFGDTARDALNDEQSPNG